MSTGPRIRVIEVLMLAIALAFAAGWIVGMFPMNREAGRIAYCAHNLRMIGQAMYIYAGDGDRFPAISNGMRAGELNLFGNRLSKPSTTDAPSPTSDLWLLIQALNVRTEQFICPASTDTPDPIVSTETVFDFAGPTNLSYAYNYQSHTGHHILGTGSDPRLAVAADANPYLKGRLPRKVSQDRKSVQRGNSANHRGRRGQNILFVDGHIEFVHSPVRRECPPAYFGSPGFDADNIYTTHADGEPADPGNAPTWTRIPIGSKSDYCLVP